MNKTNKMVMAEEEELKYNVIIDRRFTEQVRSYNYIGTSMDT